jgi:hypothetical protein
VRLVAISALYLVASTGCDALFGLTPVPGPGSGNHDAMIDSPSMRPADAAVDGPPDAYVQKTCLQLGYTITIGTSHYRSLGMVTATWTDAEADCEDDASSANMYRTHLVVLSNDVEASNVYSMVIGSAGDFWVGLSDRVVANNFKWVTNEPTGYPPANTGAPWATGEPSGGAGEDCVRDNSSVNMYDTICDNSRFYACECDLYAPIHANF